MTSHARTTAKAFIMENAVVPASSDVVGRGHEAAVFNLAVSLICFPFGPCFLVPYHGVFGLAASGWR